MLRTLSREQLLAREQALANRFGESCQAGLQLDMTRGKPAPEQLDLASGLLSLPGETHFTDPQWHRLSQLRWTRWPAGNESTVCRDTRLSGAASHCRW
jgi:hypothetical protein